MALLRSWLTKAASDLRGTRILGSADDAPLDTAIFHCQQTAEKAVKAFLVSKELSPEKTQEEALAKGMAEPSAARSTMRSFARQGEAQRSQKSKEFVEKGAEVYAQA